MRVSVLYIITQVLDKLHIVQIHKASAIQFKEPVKTGKERYTIQNLLRDHFEFFVFENYN